MPPHNNPLQRPHLRKHWKGLVKTDFKQAARKLRRRQHRIQKAKESFPRPIHALRPVVHKSTFRYSGQPRQGRGFSIEELRVAGLHPRFARTIGIAVDARRKNRSTESIERNANRLKAYVEKLHLLPRNEKKPSAGRKGVLADATAKAEPVQNTSRDIIPLPQNKYKKEAIAVTKEMNEFRAHGRLRLELTNQKWAGKRALKKQAEKA